VNEQLQIESVKHWLDKTIIGFNFCPFAKREFVNESIHYEVVDERNPQEQLHAIINECIRLDKNSDIETTLVILPVGLESYYDYLDLLEVANELLYEEGYEGIYQLASFHPDYCFEDVKYDDASNFTNRSPLPVIHIIREKSLELVLSKYPDPENIPLRNIKIARESGAKVFEKILDESKHQNS
jgi:uncharacterized protein